MRKATAYIAAFIITAMALFPPIEISLPMPDKTIWYWLVLIAGCAGLYTWFLNIDIFIKALAAYLFVSCFFSAGPLISFNAYIPVIAMIYFYIACVRIKDWRPIIYALKIIIAMNVLFLSMQLIGKDTLLNFGRKTSLSFGIVGNSMQLKSLFVISVAGLAALTRPKKSHLIAYLILLIACAGYFSIPKILREFHYFPTSRGIVWKETLKMWLERPWFGWGMATYKTIFPALFREAHSEGPLIWRTAHNCWLQLGAETGIFGLTIITAFISSLIIRLRKINKRAILALLLICADMLVHYPTRQIQCIFIMIVITAYCEHQTRSSQWQRFPPR